MLNLVRVAAEIHIKSPSVKTAFLKQLRRNLHAALTAAGHKFKITGNWARLFVDSPDPSVAHTAARVFGISSVSPVDFTTEPTMAAMCEGAAARYSEEIQGKSFAVRAKRCKVPGMTSIEAERTIGAALFPFARRVDLKNPEFTLHVEIRPEGAHFFTKRIKGPGGLPLSVEGRVLMLLSGGFDSAVAAWLMMKRGCSVDYLFLNLAGAAYERSVLTVAQTLDKGWGAADSSRIHILDFQPVATAIKANVRPAYNQVVLKRAMYQAAAGIMAKFPKRDYAAIVTGEAIGQVSSQTLHNLGAIDNAVTVPVLRPLLSFDKEEILTISRKIGTYAVSEHIQEYCALTLKHPVTRSTPARAAEEAQALDPELISAAVAGGRCIKLKDFELGQVLSDYLFRSDVPESARLIDVRDARQFQAWHPAKAENIEIDELLTSYKTLLPKTGIYVLYCPFGLQSAVAAERMQKDGYEAYSFRGGSQKLRELYPDEAWF